MDDQELISHMEELGLSNKEARVYVACLRVGLSTVQHIAEQSGIKRVTTYVILESLVGLGLVSQSTKGKKTYYVAEDPKNLQRLIERREEDLREQKVNFARILPELQGLKQVRKETPSVRYYDSADGIKTIMNSFLDRTRRPDVKLVYGFSNVDLVFDFFPEIQRNMANPGRIRAGVRSQLLYTSTQGPMLLGSDTETNRESRWLPPDKFPMLTDFTIIGDDVMMLSLGATDPVGIEIHSREIAQGLKSLFLVAWEAAAAYNTTHSPRN